MMKICRQCKEEKSKEEFPKRKTNKDGLYSWCKKCCCEKAKIHRALNPEKVQATRDKRKEKALKKAREYKEKHKKRLKVQRDLYYLKNRDKLIKKSKDYDKLNREKVSKRQKEYYKKWTISESAIEYRKTIGKERRERYAKQLKASRAITNAVRDGKLTKPKGCQICLSKIRVEGHHPDYNKPLEVVWLCRKCHRAVHKSIKEREE